MECLDCVQATARLHLYIDRELTDEEVTVVQQHLEGCQHCECRFHFDLRLKKLVHERCTLESAPPHLREAVMRLARGECVDIDADLKQRIKSDLQGY
ncbi:zf-HC2 domain-containing protein [Ktedonobacteria bacterium brp13]|nr:zf-HC2 domain-containing protein [Ktedonobacteria bacterium brp13]